jgi:hypothetical protein
MVLLSPDALIDYNTANEANLSPLLEALAYNVGTTTATFKSYKGKIHRHHGGSKDVVAKKAGKIIEVGPFSQVSSWVRAQNFL